MTKYDPKDDPSSWQHDKKAHPGAPSAGVPGGPIPVSGPMSLEQHVWLHPKTGHADYAAQQAQSDRQARREAAAAQFLHSGGRSIDRGTAANPPQMTEAQLYQERGGRN